MKVEKNDTGPLMADLTITIEKDDYLSEFKNKLKSLQSKSQLKGFRKGKAPDSIIRKMYGGHALQEIISQKLTDQINSIITDAEYNIIGEPMIKDQDTLPEIDHREPEDYVYQFKIGMEPPFEVVGLEETYRRYEITITDDLVAEEKESIQRKMGSQDNTDKNIEAGDIIYLKVEEMEGGQAKEDGIASDFSVQYDDLSEAYKKVFGTKKKGDKLEVDVYALEEKLEKEAVNKYLLKLNPDSDLDTETISDTFAAEITNVVRLTPADFDQALFDQFFGKDSVKDATEAEDKIRDYMKEYFGREADNYLNREIMENLMAKNEFDLPEGFLREWIDAESKMTDKDFAAYLKELKWALIKKKLVAKYEVNVEEKEIFDYFVNAIRNYSPYIDDTSLRNTVFSLMKNRQQLNRAVETISSGKLFDEVRKDIKTEEESIAKADFYDKVKAMQEKSAEQAAV